MTHADSNLTNPAKLPVLLLKDLSKFGTWVNNLRVEGDKILNDGDTVYFGSPKSSFMVVYEPLVVTSSCLENSAKKSLRQLLVTLGGHMISEWSKNCGMLIMSKISVTIKVICALVSLKPVVTPEYLEAYLKHLKGSSDKPDPDLFTPVVAESQLDPSEVTFATDVKRKTLFQGMTFVFLSQKQFKKMSLAIELAGGTPMLMDRAGDLGLLTEQGTVVMTCSDQEASQKEEAWIASVQKTLDRAGKHMIADAELGYAVLYVSTEKYCNPDYIAGETSLYKLPSQTLSQADAFAPDTPTQQRNTQTKKSRQKSPVKTEALATTTYQDSGHKRSTQNRRSRGASPVNIEMDTDTVTQMTSKEPSHSGKDQRSKTQEQPSQSSVATVVRVKEEVPSQPAASQSRRKRGRIIEDDDSEEETVNINKRVKTEPVTPKGKPVPVKFGDKEGKTEATVNLDSVWDSDDDVDYSKIDIDESIRISQRRTSPRRSPRHSPSRSEQTERENVKSRSRSPRISPSRSEQPERVKKRNRSRSHSPHESTKKALIKTETMSFVVADEATNLSTGKESEESRSAESRSVGSRSRGSGVLRAENAEEEKTVDSYKKAKRTRVEESDEDVNEEDGDRRGVSVHHTVPAGFLTAVKTEQKDHAAAPSVKTETEEDLPRGCGQVELVSLVVKRPKPKDTGAGDCPDGYTRWKGKVIRNFKKFRKTSHCGTNSLPKIIGGSDLEVYQGQRSREMDDWMKESMQAESQHTAEDRRAQAMFDFNPGSRRRGR